MPNPVTGEKWDTVPGTTDVLFANITKLRFTFFDVRDAEWKDSWTTQGADAGANRVPGRVKIVLSFIDDGGKEITLTTQAKLYLQEMLQFYAN